MKINNQSVVSEKSRECDEVKLKWLLDSGCTEHIIKSDEFFYKSIVSKNSVDVNLPNGKILKAEKMGKVKLWEIIKLKENYQRVRQKNQKP